MPDTEHYHFHLTDGNTENFIDWREAINGTGDSALKKIDTALFEKERVIVAAQQPVGLTENDTWLEEVK